MTRWGNEDHFAIIYKQTSEGMDTLSTKEANSAIDSAKKKIGSKTLDWGFVGGRCVVHVHVKESNLIPMIANLWLDSGLSIYVQDGSFITLKPGDRWCAEDIEKRIIEGYQEFVRLDTVDLWHKLCSPILADSAYWKSEKGRKFYQAIDWPS